MVPNHAIKIRGIGKRNEGRTEFGRLSYHRGRKKGRTGAHLSAGKKKVHLYARNTDASGEL